MPIIVNDEKGRPRLVKTNTLTKMSLAALVAYEKCLWMALEKQPDSPVLITTLNAIYREVEWRAQDT
jgi:hypothetical protein